MKHCFITPTEFINDPKIGGKSDFMLVLSHLLDKDCTNKYAEEVIKFRESWKKLYLDNGLFENHEPEPAKHLLKKAELIWAEYVFAPDFLYDREKTEIEFMNFVALKEKMDVDVKVAFVVQASHPLDYINSYKWAEDNPKVDMIGISILSVPKSFQSITQSDEITLNRIVCIKILEDLVHPKKDAHLLGLGSSLGDIIVGNKYNYIKSNDTSSAFQAWFYDKYYYQDHNEPYPAVFPGGKPRQKVDFDLEQITTKQRKLIEKNILDFKELVW